MLYGREGGNMDVPEKCNGCSDTGQWKRGVCQYWHNFYSEPRRMAREETTCSWMHVFAQRSFWKTECGYIADDPVGDFCPHCGRKIKRSES